MSTICEICHKTYASYQSLWIHNKKFHKCNDHKSKLVNEISYSETDKSNESNKNNLICSYCNKNFSTKYTLNTHYKSCSIKKFLVSFIIETDRGMKKLLYISINNLKSGVCAS